MNIRRSSKQLEAIIEYLTEKLRKAQDDIKKLKAIKENGSDLASAYNLKFLKDEDSKIFS